MTNIRKLPAGIQDFEDLRTNGYLYVDKTAYIYQLVNFGKPYFLCRPRRFGKSLFLSTLKAYFLGKKEVFDGLAIAESEKDWTEYPVIYVDLNKESYRNEHSLSVVLDSILNEYETEWGVNSIADSFAVRFDNLIKHAFVKSGRKVVVLIDEYDKPLTATLDKPELNMAMRAILKGFYGVLKSSDASLRFVMMTGVTKFSKVSIFSDLNHLVDISMDKRYAEICGITETELVKYFEPEIQMLADEYSISRDATLAKLKKLYDGYHFAGRSKGMYNPFSLLNTFFHNHFGSYWFDTGTPTFLVKMLKSRDFDVRKLEMDVEMHAETIFNYRTEDPDPLPLLYQSGYLTIKTHDEEIDLYTLGFPNDEVKYGFYNELAPVYIFKYSMSEFYAGNFIRDLQKRDVEGFMTRLKAFFADIPYELNNKGEKYYQTVFYLLFKLLGQYVEAEYRSAVGRADAIVTVQSTVYAFEFKLTERASAEDALRQIDEKGYLVPFAASGKQLVKIGVEFGEKERGIARWATG